MLINPLHNLVRDPLYKAQIKYHRLKIRKSQLQYKLAEYTNGGQRYKYTFVKMVILYRNKGEREGYRSSYEDKLVKGFQDHIVFINKAYINLRSQAVGNILHELEKHYNNDNIQERQKR